MIEAFLAKGRREDPTVPWPGSSAGMASWWAASSK